MTYLEKQFEIIDFLEVEMLRLRGLGKIDRL